MSDLYSAAFALTVLLGVVLCIVSAVRNSDKILEGIQNFFAWVDDNVVRVLFVFFMLSLFATALAGIGAI